MTPAVAVVVPVKNRADLLAALLEALTAQTLADFEVVVVDDHSDEAVDEAFRSVAHADPRFRLIDSPGVGAVAARSAGVATTSAPYLAFTDSDCVPRPDWLERGVAALEAGADVAQGRTEPERHVRPGERSIAVSRFDGLFPTCNVFYRRGAFDDAGGFDAQAGERLGFRPTPVLRGLGFGEDSLLGWRVTRGGRATFAESAVVTHHVFRADLRDSFRRAWIGGAFPALVREIPELRDTFLSSRLFIGDAGRLPLYLACVLAVLGRRRTAGVAALVWLVGRTRHAVAREPTRRRWPVAVAHACLDDAITAAALAAGSVRARTPVL